jgi:hypothetical protein
MPTFSGKWFIVHFHSLIRNISYGLRSLWLFAQWKLMFSTYLRTKQFFVPCAFPYCDLPQRQVLLHLMSLNNPCSLYFFLHFLLINFSWYLVLYSATLKFSGLQYFLVFLVYSLLYSININVTSPLIFRCSIVLEIASSILFLLPSLILRCWRSHLLCQYRCY